MILRFIIPEVDNTGFNHNDCRNYRLPLTVTVMPGDVVLGKMGVVFSSPQLAERVVGVRAGSVGGNVRTTRNEENILPDKLMQVGEDIQKTLLMLKDNGKKNAMAGNRAGNYKTKRRYPN